MLGAFFTGNLCIFLKKYIQATLKDKKERKRLIKLNYIRIKCFTANTVLFNKHI